MKLTKNTPILLSGEAYAPIARAVRRWQRDLDMTLSDGVAPSGAVKLAVSAPREGEEYEIRVAGDEIRIDAVGELGAIYALLYLSEAFLGVKPMWYWNDQVFEKREWAEVPEGTYASPTYPVRYRGWFINDEVLLDAWGVDEYDENTGITENSAFEMTMEALLRLGGNMVIPGTDFNSHTYKALAGDMGLWITHHHAEPLGAQMFARAYPELNASYDQHPEKFHGLWREGIESQKQYKVIWNIGFRGQGDSPFWANDPAYDTDEKRGALISSLIRLQYDLLHEYFEDPACCTNLYGEVMELYQAGHIQLPEDVIYVYADNGYGRMVTRRMGNHNPRIPALPPRDEGRHGVYYHASFYDLQAANHMSAAQNSTEEIRAELRMAYGKGIRDFWVVNCSNVKPHAALLTEIAGMWGRDGKPYEEEYYENAKDVVASFRKTYHDSMIRFGENWDEKAGDQFYHYNIRYVAHGWLLSKFEECEDSLIWVAGEKPLDEQVRLLTELSDGYAEKMACLEKATLDAEEKIADPGEAYRFHNTFALSARIHTMSYQAQQHFLAAYGLFREGNGEEAFFRAGQAKETVEKLISCLAECSCGRWAGYFDNECLVDMRFTVHTISVVMGYIRNACDGPQNYDWALKYTEPRGNSRVVLITNMRLRPTTEELYAAMKKKRGM